VAARMLNIHQDAWRIDYAMRSIRYPVMDEYVKGAPVQKVEFYNTTFILRPAQDALPTLGPGASARLP